MNGEKKMEKDAPRESKYSYIYTVCVCVCVCVCMCVFIADACYGAANK